MKTKIVYIVDNLKTGGAQTQLSRMIEGFSDEPYEIKVICLGPYDDHLVRQIGKERITFVTMTCIWNLQFWLSYKKMKNRLKEIKPDIVHTYLNTSNVFGALAAKKKNVPLIVTSRRDMGHFRSKRIARMEKRSNEYCRKIVCVSNAVRVKTVHEENVESLKVVALHGGINPDIFKTEKTDYKVDGVLQVGMVASMDREMKGHKDFLLMANQVLKSRDDVQFILVGDGTLKQELVEFVKEENIVGHVTFKGQCEDVPAEIRAMDVFVMPSHSEGFSNAVLEAMAMQVPVLANAIEGNLEIIEDSVDGMLVESRNIDEMASRICKMADVPHKLKDMGQKARTKILSNFTIDHMVQRYNDFYTNLLKEL